MKNIKLMCLIIALPAMMSTGLVLARGKSVSDNIHVNNGHLRLNLARGGHRHAGGGGRHFTRGGGHRSHRHNSFSLGINFGGGYYNSGFYSGYGFGYPYGGLRYGHGFGYPYYGYSYYPRPYYYPRTIVAPLTPPVYIQQEDARPVQPQTNYWYYCQNPEGYYPYVRQCLKEWLPVAPQPLVK